MLYFYTVDIICWGSVCTGVSAPYIHDLTVKGEAAAVYPFFNLLHQILFSSATKGYCGCWSQGTTSSTVYCKQGSLTQGEEQTMFFKGVMQLQLVGGLNSGRTAGTNHCKVCRSSLPLWLHLGNTIGLFWFRL